MSDTVIASRDDLEEALTEFRLGVRRDNGDHEGATVSEPRVVADVLMRTLSRRLAEKLQGPPGDPELAAIATAVARLECLDDLAQRRVLRYLADRYGTGD